LLRRVDEAKGHLRIPLAVPERGLLNVAINRGCFSHECIGDSPFHPSEIFVVRGLRQAGICIQLGGAALDLPCRFLMESMPGLDFGPLRPA